MKRKLDEENVPVPVPVTGSQKLYERSAFSSLGLDSRLQQAVLKEQYSIPTPVQSKAIPLALEGKDIFGNIALIHAMLLCCSSGNGSSCKNRLREDCSLRFTNS